MPITRTAIVLAFVAVFVCVVPAPTGRAQTDAAVVTPILMETVIRAAELAYTRDLARARASGALNADRGQLAGLRRILQPLLFGAGTLRSDAKNWNWAISVETRNEPVAYCLPGGRILVSTGFIERPKLTLAEQSALLAHAIAHALAGHDADEAMARLAREGGAASADPNRTVVRLADILAKVVAAEPHATADERTADTLALELMARSGVDPRASVDAWRKIARAGGATPPGFLALHPTWPERFAELEAQMPAMVALYETTLRERSGGSSLVLPPAMPGRR